MLFGVEIRPATEIHNHCGARLVCMDAALYLRQSRDFTGEELGITRQREDGVGLAARRDWTILATHTDNDISGSGKVKRPGFDALL